jgi:hypothetical protein
MALQSIAVASAKSFGDFVIAHSVLRRVEQTARRRARLVACTHLEALSTVLSADVDITLVNSGEDRVPALFDVKKFGTLAAVRSALTLRQRFQTVERNDNEVLAFEALGVRERFIAGHWPVIGPRTKSPNVYETYAQLFDDHGIRLSTDPPIPPDPIRSVGVFPESRLVAKRLTASTVALILERAARARVAARVFILEGDESLPSDFPAVARISRNFQSLADAIRSVDSVVSADSLPAHLAEYFVRPVFVASPAPNEYWLPLGCYLNARWASFGDESRLSASLDKFLAT